jgi:hypothetical protein
MNPAVTCEFTQTHSDSGILLSLRGSLNENCQWPELTLPIQGQLRIDLQEVALINSIGSRDWARWLGAIQATNGISLQNCPPVFVRQMNIFSGLVPKSVAIESFYVDYACLSCNSSKLVLLVRGRDFFPPPKPLLPRSITCPNCQDKMELDAAIDRYFNFLGLRSA